MKRIVVLVILLSLGLGVALYLRLSAQRARSAAPAGGSGVLEGVEVDVVARVPARVKALHVRAGDPVEVGALLVELDCAELEAGLDLARAQLQTAEGQLAAARAGAGAASRNTQAARITTEALRSQVDSARVGVEGARREKARVESMSQAGAVSASRLDQIQTQVDNLTFQVVSLESNEKASSARARAAQAQELMARAQILAAEGQVEMARAGVSRAALGVAECRLVAPRAARVQAVNHEVGEAVLPGARLLSLVDLREMRATFYLPNAELAAAAPGKAVSVRADPYPDQVFHGRIRHVSARAEFTPRNVQTREERDRLVYAVEIELPNPGERLRAGMPVEVTIDGSAGTATPGGRP
jgi:HlyD family secretion protein